jgi:uncharacterized membrane protein
MLLYLINVVDNAWLLGVGLPLVLHLLSLDPARRGVRRLVLSAAGLGLLAAGILAYLRLTTGWVIREFYDLGVLIPLTIIIVGWLFIAVLAQKNLEKRAVSAAGISLSFSGRKRPGAAPTPNERADERRETAEPLETQERRETEERREAETERKDDVSSSAAEAAAKAEVHSNWRLDAPLSPAGAWVLRLIIGFLLSLGLVILFYKIRFTRHAALLSVLGLGLATVFSFGPLKIKNPRLPLLVSSLAVIALLTARTAPNLILYPFEFGVGLDSYFTLEYLSKVAGYVFGLTIILLVWLSIRFLARQASARLFKWVAVLAILVIISQLLLETVQILAARRMVNRTIFSIVLFLLERKSIFLFAQIGVWTALSLFLIVKSRLTVPTGSNPALRRKMKANLRADLRAGALLLFSMALVIFASTTLRAINSRGPVISEPKEIKISAGMLKLDLEAVNDGNLHRHVYQTEDGTSVRFIVIKKSQTAYGVGLDACDICGATGYYQRGDQVICRLCDVVMNKSTIGFPGGCNPVPLAFSLAEGFMLIDPADLEAEAHRFK